MKITKSFWTSQNSLSYPQRYEHQSLNEANANYLWNELSFYCLDRRLNIYIVHWKVHYCFEVSLNTKNYTHVKKEKTSLFKARKKWKSLSSSIKTFDFNSEVLLVLNLFGQAPQDTISKFYLTARIKLSELILNTKTVQPLIRLLSIHLFIHLQTVETIKNTGRSFLLQFMLFVNSET